MKKSKNLKSISLILAILLCIIPLYSCSPSSGSNKDAQKLVWNLETEPKTIDPALNTEGGNVPRAIFDCLTKLNKDGNPVPGCTEALPEISADGLTYTFKIRKDAKWQDGKDLVAKDFVYSFLRVLKPETGSQYATEFYYIKNAKPYNEGTGNKEDVGLRAIDDKTLEITLESPIAYFTELVSMFIYAPVREDVVTINGSDTSDVWSRDPKTCITNGPFKLKEWISKDKIVVEKNENWYGAKDVKLTEIDFKMIEEASTAIAAFQNNEIDFTDTVPAVDVPSLKEKGECQILPQISVNYLSINLTDKLKSISPEAYEALQKKEVRQALSYAIDRQSIVDKVTQNGEKPALAFVPYGVKDDKGQDFHDKDYFQDNNIAKAKELLAQAGYPDGKGFPTITLTYQTDQIYKLVIEAIQEMWNKNLGINIELATEEWKVYQVTRKEKNFMIGRNTWIGDYMDPNTFLELLSSSNGNNHSGYNNSKYDELINNCRVEPDKAKRISMFREAESIIMDDMPIIPIYYFTDPVAIKPYVKGFFKLPSGNIYFDQLYIEGKGN